MTNTEFRKVAVNAVVDYFNSKKEKTDQYVMTEDDVYIVWLCKTLQNHKAMLSTMVLDGTSGSRADDLLQFIFEEAEIQTYGYEHNAQYDAHCLTFYFIQQGYSQSGENHE